MSSSGRLSGQQSLTLGVGEQLELGDGDVDAPSIGSGEDEDAYTDFEDEDEDEDNRATGWADVEELAYEWSNVWADGSEVAWLGYAWGALYRSGLVHLDDARSRAASLARLLALVTHYRVFHAYAHETEHVEEWYGGGYDLTGPYPRVGAFAWGVLAADAGLDVDVEDDEELPHHFSRELIRHYSPEVATALTTELGENFLFASLWASSASGVRFPLSDRRYQQAVNEDPFEKAAAYSWVSDGMPL